MTCREYRVQISGHLDGALSPAETLQVLTHVAGCDSCRSFLQEQERMIEWLRADGLQVAPPAHLWDRIESRIAGDPQVTFDSGWSAWMAPQRLGYALAASLLLAVISGSLFLGSQNVDRQLLAQLDAYQVAVPDNPFLAQPEVANPFFEPLAEVEGNPFDQIRSPK